MNNPHGKPVPRQRGLRPHLESARRTVPQLSSNRMAVHGREPLKMSHHALSEIRPARAFLRFWRRVRSGPAAPPGARVSGRALNPRVMRAKQAAPVGFERGAAEPLAGETAAWLGWKSERADVSFARAANHDASAGVESGQRHLVPACLSSEQPAAELLESVIFLAFWFCGLFAVSLCFR